MASKKLNVQLIKMQEDGSMDKINPFTTSKNVSVIPQNNIPSSATDTQSVFNALGSIAFEGGDNDVVFIGYPDSEEDMLIPKSEINDEMVSVAYTWSSLKIDSYLEQATYIEYVDENSNITANCLPPSEY